MQMTKSLILFILPILKVFSSTSPIDDQDENLEEEMVAIGIDLGTTYSCVGYYNPTTHDVEILADKEGNLTTPSVILLDQDGFKVGLAAKNYVGSNPNKFWDSKRVLGKTINDGTIQSKIKNNHWPFKIVERNQGNQGSQSKMAAFELKDQGKYSSKVTQAFFNKKSITPSEVSTAVLRHLIDGASRKIGKRVTHVVITVPAYFGNEERELTKEAAQAAGVEVLRVINEPTSAALAYGIDGTIKETVFVFDLGGGTFDISILELEGAMTEVLATKGDNDLGGQDFDNMISELFLKANNLTIKDLSDENRQNLKNMCENAKKILSLPNKNEAKIELEISNKKYDYILTKEKFNEELSNSFKNKIIKPMKEALKASKLEKNQINKVLLVGGSSRIPWIQDLVSQFMTKKVTEDPNVDLDTSVAHGAALMAAKLAKIGGEKLDELVVADVTPFAIGIETVGGVMAKIIEENSNIPTTNSQTFRPQSAHQTAVTIAVYQGPYKLVKRNKLLGQFNLEQIGKNFPEIEVKISIDANGITSVSAHEKGNNVKKDIVLQKSGSMSQKEKEDMKNAFKEVEKQDELEWEVETNKQSIISKITQAFENIKDEDVKKQLQEILENTNKLNDYDESTLEKLKDLHAKMESILQIAGGAGKADEDEPIEDDEHSDEDSGFEDDL